MKKRWKRLISILLMCCVMVGMLPTIALAEDNEDETQEWLFSGAAQYDSENQYYILTPDDTMECSGAMWYPLPVTGDFTLSLDYYTGSTDRPLGGADGITVAFWAENGYKLPNGKDMGFTGSNGYGIELDTYYDGDNSYFDPQYNHIGLVKESSRNHIATAPLPESEDEQWHKLKIVVENNVCSAYVDGTLKIQNEVTPTGHNWLGITAATHSGTNLHAVKNILIDTKINCFDVFVDSMPKLSPEEAKVFIEFICNAERADVNADNATYGKMYRLMTGDVSQYNGDLLKLRTDMIALATFIRAQSASKVQQYSEASKIASQATVDLAMTFAPSNGKISDADLGIISEYQNKVKEYFRNGLKEFGYGVCGLYVTDEKLRSVEDTVELYLDTHEAMIKSVKQAEKILNGVMTAVYGLNYACSLQLTNAYDYFNEYLSMRESYESLGPEAFSLIMDFFFETHQLSQKNYFVLMTQWVANVPNWGDSRTHIESWAEYVYEIEQASKNGVVSQDKNIVHDWSEYTVIQKPTCIAEGIKERICTICGMHQQVSITKTSHSWSEWVIDAEPTGKADGSKHRTCDYCGALDTASIDKLDLQKLTWTADSDVIIATYGQTTDIQNVAKNSLSDGGKITYSSSNNNVATVNNKGLISIHGSGVAEIQATATKIPDKYAEASISYTLIVSKKPVTISVDNKTKLYGTANPTFTFTIPKDCLVGNDDISALDVHLNCEADDKTPAGSVIPITGTSNSKNYNVTIVPGSLTIQSRNTSSSGGTHSTVSSASYSLSTPNAENGKISVTSTAKKGDTVTISVTPDTGYKLDKLTVTDSKGNTLTVSDKGNGKYTFIMPDSKVTVTSTFVSEATKPAETRFVDVADNAWYAEAVNYVADKGMMNGIGENKFAPNATTTRGMLMTVLARYAGQDTSDSNPWYQKGMDWAVNQKVSDGTNPTVNITREQLVTMLYRYAGSPVASGGSLSDFSDTAAVSDYAVSAMQWAVTNSIVNGANGKLNPKNNATRAEVAAILMRFCEMNK